MKYTMTTPCDQCPFLKSMAHGFSMRRLREFASGEFPCHKSLTEADILELEVRPYDEVYARPFNKRMVRLTVEERDALVETVRAAWARIAELERTALNEQKKRLVRFLSKQGYAPCTEPDHDCDGWHERLTP